MGPVFGEDEGILRNFFRASTAAMEKIKAEEEKLRKGVTTDAEGQKVAAIGAFIAKGIKDVTDRLVLIELDAPQPLSLLAKGGKRRKAYDDLIVLLEGIHKETAAVGGQFAAVMPSTRDLFVRTLDFYTICIKELKLRVGVFDMLAGFIDKVYASVEDVIRENVIFPPTPELAEVLKSLRKIPIVVDIGKKTDLEAQYLDESQAVAVYPLLILSNLRGYDSEHVFVTLAHEVAHAVQMSMGPWKKYESSLFLKMKSIGKLSLQIRDRMNELSGLVGIKSDMYPLLAMLREKVDEVQKSYSEQEMGILTVQEGFAMLVQLMVALKISDEWYRKTIIQFPENYKKILREFALGSLGVKDVNDISSMKAAMKHFSEWVESSDEIGKETLKAISDMENDMVSMLNQSYPK
jgi:hypothetical protein